MKDCDFNTPTYACAYCGFVCHLPAARRNCPARNSQAVIPAPVFVGHGPGPGTELHTLLGRFGLTASGDCKCNSRAAYMDQQGCDWCEANVEEIVGWLRESAAERGLPFLDVAATLLVRRAIANARRKEAARGTEDRPPLRSER